MVTLKLMFERAWPEKQNLTKIVTMPLEIVKLTSKKETVQCVSKM